MENIKRKNQLARSILGGSLSAAAWTFEALFFVGELTLDSFLRPSLYVDLPSSYYSKNNSDKKLKKKKYKETSIRQSLWRLRKQGFVRKDGGIYSLTAKGREIASYILNIKKTVEKKWDGKYRVVIFDIPEKDAASRNWFRQELYLLNYKQLQKSVFVSKSPLTKDLIREIKSRKMGNCINYLLVDKIYKNIL